MNPIQELVDLVTGREVGRRQQDQWQIANDSLDAAATHLSNGNVNEAIAAALLGLLAERLSAR